MIYYLPGLKMTKYAILPERIKIIINKQTKTIELYSRDVCVCVGVYHYYNNYYYTYDTRMNFPRQIITSSVNDNASVDFILL